MFTRKPYRSYLAKKNAKDKLNSGRQHDIMKTKFNILACTHIAIRDWLLSALFAGYQRLWGGIWEGFVKISELLNNGCLLSDDKVEG